jgi:uncharacterized protein YjbJ (UPF0337 family)
MNWDIAEGNWKIFKSKVREKYSKLTDDDVEYGKSKREHIEGELQKKYGMKKDEAESKVDEILASIS